MNNRCLNGIISVSLSKHKNTHMKVLGTKHGIEITKPWNPAMYEHNDKVADKMKEAIFAALNKAYKEGHSKDLEFIAKSIGGYGYGPGHDSESIHIDACRNLEMVENYWLHDWSWSELVEAGYVQDFDEKFVGYDR
jgi:hypothetical protein